MSGSICSRPDVQVVPQHLPHLGPGADFSWFGPKHSCIFSCQTTGNIGKRLSHVCVAFERRCSERAQPACLTGIFWNHRPVCTRLRSAQKSRRGNGQRGHMPSGMCAISFAGMPLTWPRCFSPWLLPHKSMLTVWLRSAMQLCVNDTCRFRRQLPMWSSA